MTSTKSPTVGVAHVAMHTHCMDETIQFMLAVGMVPVFQGPKISVLELRGGTHLLLFCTENVTEQDASFDLMVDDLGVMYKHLSQLGYEPSAIVDKPDIGHQTFDVTEPAGGRITFFSNHATCQN